MPTRPLPYPFQREGVRLLRQANGRALLADDTGLGKSPQYLWFFEAEKSLRPGIIICPAGLKRQWQEEARKFIGIDPLVLEGMRPNVSRQRLLMSPLLIANYEILGTRGASGWLEVLRSIRPKTICGDEIHRIANMFGKQSINFRTLCAGVPSVIGMSGSALVNRPGELWAIINLLWPEEFDSVWDFLDRYCEVVEKDGMRWQGSGVRNGIALNKRLLKCGMIRRLKSEVLRDLPPKRTNVVVCPLSNPKEYEQADRDFIGWLASWNPEKATSALRSIQFTRFTYMKGLAAQLKMAAVEQWHDDWLAGNDGKILVFCLSVNEGPKAVRRFSEKYKDICVTIHGGVSQDKREIAKQRFMTDPKIRMLVGQIKACGEGLNLQAASAVSHVELAFNHVTHAQGTARAWRLGVKHAVDEYFFVADGTVERKLCEYIQTKQGVSDQVLDGVKSTPGGLYILDELTRMLLQDSKQRKG